MVATMDAASAARLARLFAAPSKQGMLELDWAEFEDFVQHVFECAGYAVEKVSSRPKHNVDLVLHAGHIEGKVVARVEVRRYQTARLPRAHLAISRRSAWARERSRLYRDHQRIYQA